MSEFGPDPVTERDETEVLASAAPVGEPTAEPMVPTAPAEPTELTDPTAPAAPHRNAAVVRDPATVLRAPLEAVRGVLPDSPVPVALGVGALALGGLIEWPVAGAIGLGYLALRRWHPAAASAGVHTGG